MNLLISDEQGLLANLLVHSGQIPEAMQQIKTPEALFDDPMNQLIFDEMISDYQQNGETDIIRIRERLKKLDPFKNREPIEYLAELADSALWESAWRLYVNPVLKERQRRFSQRIGQELVQRSNDTEADPLELWEATQSEVNRIQDSILSKSAPKKTRPEILGEILTDLERAYNDPNFIDGIATGFRHIDMTLRGLKPGQVFVIGARPGNGKTSLAVNILTHVSIESGIPSLFFSMEMSEKEITKRIVCAHAGVNPSRLADRDSVKLSKSFQAVKDAPFLIEDETGVTPEFMRAKIAEAVKNRGVKIVFLDYLQLMESKGETRQTEITKISREIKKCAKDFEIPIVALCQLNRESDKAAGRKPKLSDLRESGAIEQDADIVGLIHLDKAESTEDLMPANFLIAKNRSGPTNEIDLAFHREFTRFETVTRYQAPDDI